MIEARGDYPAGKEVQAYCPASISLIFRVHEHHDPAQMGSTGVGFTIDQGVTATVVESARSQVFFNNEPIKFPTVSWLARELTPVPVTINLHTPLPLGCGFGISGASALATSFTLNQLCELSKTRQELVRLAHVSEVKHRTGLGTVATQSYGGFLIRSTPGSASRVKTLPFIGQRVYAAVRGKLETPSVLNDKKAQSALKAAANRVLLTLKDSPSPTLEGSS